MTHRIKMLELCMMRLVCAIALVFVGFAHQVPAIAGEARGSVELAQYLLPDGTLAPLCTTVIDGAGEKHGKVGHLQGCEACRINASALLPMPADIVGARLGFVRAVELQRRIETIHRQLYPPNTGPRAPPSDPLLV
ncbi:hypothetical protein [Rhizobium sp. Root1220]|uniref:hypothetical protein n=1 Tax=Rhizobium sp. Root1220 TaxID=1736432 RepID=UPI0006FAA956|nr:hypothetical protein [Rhizobium sp. Root1220]KQV65180.1 hypothetical protein ASC90_14915 [Rhizobium sp. Root1220]